MQNYIMPLMALSATLALAFLVARLFGKLRQPQAPSPQPTESEAIVASMRQADNPAAPPQILAPPVPLNVDKAAAEPQKTAPAA